MDRIPTVNEIYGEGVDNDDARWNTEGQPPADEDES